MNNAIAEQDYITTTETTHTTLMTTIKTKIDEFDKLYSTVQKLKKAQTNDRILNNFDAASSAAKVEQDADTMNRKVYYGQTRIYYYQSIYNWIQLFYWFLFCGFCATMLLIQRKYDYGTIATIVFFFVYPFILLYIMNGFKSIYNYWMGLFRPLIQI